MKRIALALALASSLLAPLSGIADATISRSYALKAGWNAVWLDVTPSETEIHSVTDGLPLLSIWTHRRRAPSTDFIANPNEPVWNRDEWLVHVPTNRLESLDNNLFHIFGERAYLIELSADATWTVTGRPSARKTPWATDAWTLLGFPIDDGAPPTFRDFFAASPAHYHSATGALAPIYRLGASGAWELVNPTDLMAAGAAYWVYTTGSSDFFAPLEVTLDTASGELEFGRSVNQREITVRNRSAAPVVATLQENGAPPTTALGYAIRGATASPARPPLPSLLSLDLTAGASRTILIAALRAAMTDDSYESILEIRDNAGTRVLIPVSVQRFTPESASSPGLAQARGGARRGLHAGPGGGSPHAGLWVGLASISGVSEVHSGTLQTNSVGSDGVPIEVERVGVSTNTRPVRSEFDLRLIIHVDAGGNARLLKEVIQMWQDGTTRIDEDGYEVVDRPGRFVLLTDDTRVGEFRGATLRDGEPVGRRISTIGFDFPSTHTNNFLSLTGDFELGSTLSGSFTVFPQQPTNPYRHKYHPDHDNLDPTFTSFRAEAFEVNRAFELEFTDMPPDGSTRPPGYGYDYIAGHYRETVTGLHREPIHASGSFRLRRVSLIPDLDPVALP